MSARRAYALLAAPVESTVEAICRIRLAPGQPSEPFERWLASVPAISSAVCVTGDVDYELRLCCHDFTEVSDVIARLRGCGGAEIVSTSLVLREIAVLGEKPELRRLPRPR